MLRPFTLYAMLWNGGTTIWYGNDHRCLSAAVCATDYSFLNGRRRDAPPAEQQQTFAANGHREKDLSLTNTLRNSHQTRAKTVTKDKAAIAVTTSLY